MPLPPRGTWAHFNAKKGKRITAPKAAKGKPSHKLSHKSACANPLLDHVSTASTLTKGYAARMWASVPLGTELYAIYFALLDDTIPVTKKALALGGPGVAGYIGGAAAGGAPAAAAVPVVGGLLGAVTGPLAGVATALVSAYVLLVEDRHVSRSKKLIELAQSDAKLKKSLEQRAIEATASTKG